MMCLLKRKKNLRPHTPHIKSLHQLKGCSIIMIIAYMGPRKGTFNSHILRTKKQIKKPIDSEGI